MSSRHCLAFVLTLKRTVPPRFTLMSVAKPWIDVSPRSNVGMSHCEDGVPGRQFSRSMSFAGEAHELYAFAETTSASTGAKQRHSSQPSENIRVVFLFMPLPELPMC